MLQLSNTVDADNRASILHQQLDELQTLFLKIIR